jgi:hypothetical protein
MPGSLAFLGSLVGMVMIVAVAGVPLQLARISLALYGLD